MKETMLMIVDAIGMIVFVALVAALVYFASGCGAINPTPDPDPQKLTCEQVCRHAGDELACPDYIDQEDGTRCQDWLCNMADMPGIDDRWQCIISADSCDQVDECP